MRWLIPLVFVIATTAPAQAGVRSRRNAEPPPAPKPPVIQVAQWEQKRAPGSLLQTVPARQLLGQEGYARQPGDIVTVMIVERTSTSLDANTDTKNSSEMKAGVGALFGLENPIALGAGASGDLGVSGGRSATYTGSGKVGRGSSLDTILSCTVTEVVLPSRNLKLWCSKQISVNRETQWVVLEGLVRARDIGANNMVTSNLIAHAKIEVSGRGVIDDKQRPGLLVRVLDAIWPF
jgi:flagellar L-ring protein precursor FlgH